MINLCCQDRDDGHCHPLHVLVFVVAQPLHHQFGSFKPLNKRRQQNQECVVSASARTCVSIIFALSLLFCFSHATRHFSPVEWDLLQNAIAAQREQTVLLQLEKIKNKNKTTKALLQK